VDNSSNTLLRTYENCLLWTFDTAVWIEHLDEQKGAATHVFDPIASQDYLIPCGND
jgi:hypothetical protein